MAGDELIPNPKAAEVPVVPDDPEVARQEVDEAISQAKTQRKKKQYNEAVQTLLNVLDHGFKKDVVLFQLGNVFFDAGDISRAEYSYRRATEENPDHANAHHNLGVVYKKQGKIAESVRMQRTAVKLQLKGVNLKGEGGRGEGDREADPTAPAAGDVPAKAAKRSFWAIGLLIAVIFWLLFLR